MVCLYCQSATIVKNSRLQKRSNHIWRRRECSGCSAVFTTNERAELELVLMVEDRGKKLEPFNRDQLFITIYESCRHRPTAAPDASALTQTVLNKLISIQREGIIERKDIALAARQVLQRFDQTAAAVYEAYHPI